MMRILWAGLLLALMCACSARPTAPSTPPTRGAVPPCAALAPKLINPQGAAGTEYMTLRLTNASANACMVRGYPTVKLVDASGQALGSKAQHNANQPVRTITVNPGGHVDADVGFPNAMNFEAGVCAAGAEALSVQLAGSSTVRTVSDEHPSCPGWSVSPLH